jgi:phosphoribosylaminoimidazolecarboxamide formyltransferase/IMP cyclohydrolase
MAHFDVGGHALLRASVKNYEDVVPVVDPGDYGKVLQEIERGELSESTRLELASKAMAHVGTHDQAFQVYLEELKRGVKKPFPETLCLAYRKLLELRYGENPHLRAVLYADGEGLARAEHIGGPPPSFNNFADMDAGWDLVLEFEEPAVAIIKHGSPCGVAVSGTLVKALESARACDPPSAYGSVIAINRPLDRSTAENLISDFVEVVVAPGYDSGVVEILERKRRLRIFRASLETRKRREFKQISGGVLVQEPDVSRLEPLRLNFVTRKKPSETELKDLVFAWRVVKHVKSNAIVLAKQLKTVGIGGGQPSRVGAVELALKKAGSNAEGSVLASDGFFPFADSIELAARAGVSAVIQPGGSIRDSEVISAADERGLKMVFTGVRCFKH